MTEITEGDLTFSFPDGCQVVKYDACSDDWSYYRRSKFQRVADAKAVDILCVEGDTSWLIEIKDYRRCSLENFPKPSELAKTVAMKVRDTLAGLAVAAKEGNNEVNNERKLAQQALATKKWRIVLHLEQPTTSSKLWPQLINPATLLIQLSRLLRAVDTEPITCSRYIIPRYIFWTVRSK